MSISTRTWRLIALMSLSAVLLAPSASAACWTCNTNGSCSFGQGNVIAWDCNPPGGHHRWGTFACCSSTAEPCNSSYNSYCGFYYYSCYWTISSECGSGGWGSNNEFCHDCQ